MYTLCAIDKQNEQFFVDGIFLNKNARVVVDTRDQDVYLIILGKGYVTCFSVRLAIAGRHILPGWSLKDCIDIYFAFFQDHIFQPMQQKAS